MPYARVHAARQMPPGSCDSIRTEADAMGDGVAVLWCVRAGKPVEPESIHFDARKFTPEQAKVWLKKHDFSAAEFVPAGPEPRAAAPPALCGADATPCPMGEKCPRGESGGDAYAAGPTELKCGGSGGLDLLEAQASDAGPRRLSMTGYTGVPMRLEGFHLPVVVDLESLRVPRQSVPILRSHDPERVAGHTTSVDVSPRRLKAEGVLSGQPGHTDDVVGNASRGFPWQVSIGASRPPKLEHVREGETVKVNGRNWNGPLLVARGATLRELSVLPLGADGDTSASVAANLAGDILAFSHNSETHTPEPDWGSVDKTSLPMLAFADHGKGEGEKSTWGYPHHWVSGGGAKDDAGVYTTGTMYLHRGGLDAAWAAAQGAHTGSKASQAVIDHLQAHRSALGLDKSGG